MPTFLDESGDTGPVATSGIPYFRLTAVWVPSHAAAEAFRADVCALREALRLPAGFEFKFSKSGSHPDRRAAFFRTALRHPFRFAVAAIDKRDAYWGRAGRQEIHWACAASLAVLLRPVYREAEAGMAACGDTGPLNELVILDDNEDQKFLAIVRKEFGQLPSANRPGAPLVKRVRFRGSGPDELVQLADMVVGATGAYLDGQAEWFEMIRERCVGVMRLP